AVREPDLALLQRPGKTEAGCPTAENELLLVLDSGHKVRCGITETVVAHFGVDRHNARGTLTVFGGNRSGFNRHRLHRLHAQAGLKCSSKGVGNIEPVERIVGLALSPAVNVNAAAGGLDNAGQSVKDVLEGVVVAV